MKEWHSKFNSFNSDLKGLSYWNYYEAIKLWRDGKGKPLAPVEVSLDPFRACQLHCSHCFEENSKILMGDFSLKAIKDVKIGDEILGQSGRVLVGSKVLNVFDNGNTETLLSIKFDDEETILCTPDHKIFKPTRNKYSKAATLAVGEKVRKIGNSIRFEDSIDYMSGYVSGMASGDGCFWVSKNRTSPRTGRFRLAIYDSDAQEFFGKCLTSLNIKWHWGRHQFKGHRDYEPNKKYDIDAIWITDDINSKKVKILMDSTSENLEFVRGYLAGIFDAEGSFTSSIRIHQQKKQNIYERISKCLVLLGFNHTREKKALSLNGNFYEKSRFFTLCQPKILRKWKYLYDKGHTRTSRKIVSKTFVSGNFNKFDLETTTGNYFVSGVLVHNCNASRYLEDDQKERVRIPDDVFPNLISFLANWGTKAICFGGGGEPTLHTSLGEMLKLSKGMGMENSIATNGINFDDELIKTAVETCRWIGVSVDAAYRGTYLKGRGVDKFYDTINTIKKLSKYAADHKLNCDVAYKFLLFEYNQHEVYDACQLAKAMGAKDFHVRPADLSHQGMHSKYKGKASPYDIESVKAQFEKCHELADEKFRVFTVVHKFDDQFLPKKPFSQCYAAPCCIQICPNGKVYFCPDQRYNESYCLGDWYPDPFKIEEFWGSEKHYDLVFNSGKCNCNTRCTFNPYNEQAEKLVMNSDDPICRNFI